MHSRAVLFLSLFAFAGLVVAGSIALHLTSASAAAGEGVVNSRSGDNIDAASDSSSNPAFFGDPYRPGIPEAATELSARERSSADSLETLLRQVHVMFEPEGAGVSNAMIPFLAEMITIINQHDHLLYRIEIHEPDAALAQARVQTLNDVLRLNVSEPSNLLILGQQGLRAAFVEVSGS